MLFPVNSQFCAQIPLLSNCQKIAEEHCLDEGSQYPLVHCVLNEHDCPNGATFDKIKL